MVAIFLKEHPGLGDETQAPEVVAKPDSEYTIEDLRNLVLGYDYLDNVSPQQLLQLPVKEVVNTLQDLIDSRNLETRTRAQTMMIRYSQIRKRDKRS